MKVGSIVVVLRAQPQLTTRRYINWLPVADEQTPYVVRHIEDTPYGTGIALEEGVIGYMPDGQEIKIHINYVRELLPPKNEAIDEEIENLIREPMLETA